MNTTAKRRNGKTRSTPGGSKPSGKGRGLTLEEYRRQQRAALDLLLSKAGA